MNADMLGNIVANLSLAIMAIMAETATLFGTRTSAQGYSAWNIKSNAAALSYKANLPGQYG
jgi:hypothetical protein